VATDADELAGLLSSGRVSPHIGGRYPLSRAADALAELAHRRAIGKVLVLPGG